MTRRWLTLLSALWLPLLALVSGCADERSLRIQQAEEMRRLCQAFGGEPPGGDVPQDPERRLDLQRFMVGGEGGIDHPLEVVHRCTGFDEKFSEFDE